MKNTIDEKISACLDDELDQFGSRRVVDELLSSEERRQRYLSYQLIGDVLRNDVPESLDVNFSQKVMQSISEDQELLPDHMAVQSVTDNSGSGSSAVRSKPAVWVRPMAGFALAASVTAITLVGLNSFTSIDTDSAIPVPVAAISIPSEIPASSILPLGNNTVPVSAESGAVLAAATQTPAVATLETQSQIRTADVVHNSPVNQTLKMEQPFLRNYLAAHTEYAAPRGTLSHVRLVGYRSDPAKSTDE